MAGISWAPTGAAERRWPPLLALAALCGFLFFYGLNVGELYRTEGLRGPRGGGVPALGRLARSPPLRRAVADQAAAGLRRDGCRRQRPFGGVTDWAARLPSAVAATLVVFLMYGCFRRHFGRAAGLTAAALLPCSLMWLDRAPSAEIDMLQVAWVAGAVLCFLRAVECREEAERPNGMAVAAGRAPVRGRRCDDEMDGPGLLLPDGDPVSPLAAPAVRPLGRTAPGGRRRGGRALPRLGGGGRLPRRLGAAVRHRCPRGAATPVAAAPRSALPVGRGRDVPPACSWPRICRGRRRPF